MTLIVGILCKDGVVVASDSAATFGTGIQPTIGQQEVQKVRRLNDHILYSSTGAVGMSQVIADRVRQLWDSKAFASMPSADAVMDKIGKEIVQIVGPYLQTAQFQQSLTGGAASSLCKSMVAMPVAHQPQLFQFDFNGAPERSNSDLPFISLGSGQAIADPFLAFLRRLLWSGREPTVSEGRLAAVWTIDHVRRTNPGGVGGGIQLATLGINPGKMPTVSMASTQDVEEHLQRVGSAEAALVNELLGKVQDAVSPVPLPEHPALTGRGLP